MNSYLNPRPIFKYITFVLSTILIVTLIRCKEDPEGEQIIPYDNTDEMMNDILVELTDEYTPITDLTPVHVNNELNDLAKVDTALRYALEAIADYNFIIEHPGTLLEPSTKSATAGGWVLINCANVGTMYECSWEMNRGAYKYKLIQVVDHTMGTQDLECLVSGTLNGQFYGTFDEDYYVLWDCIISNHLKNFALVRYFVPFNEEVSGKPEYTFVVRTGEECTIYTPWETYYNTEYIIENSIYSWVGTGTYHKAHYCYTKFVGDVVESIISFYCLNYDEVRPMYYTHYDFLEHEGTWCFYDCDKVLIECNEY